MQSIESQMCRPGLSDQLWFRSEGNDRTCAKCRWGFDLKQKGRGGGGGGGVGHRCGRFDPPPLPPGLSTIFIANFESEIGGVLRLPFAACSHADLMLGQRWQNSTFFILSRPIAKKGWIETDPKINLIRFEVPLNFRFNWKDDWLRLRMQGYPVWGALCKCVSCIFPLQMAISQVIRNS